MGDAHGRAAADLPRPDGAPAGEPGWRVLHLFFRLGPAVDATAVELAVKACEASGHQVVTAACLGHKADLAVLALGPSEVELLRLQRALQRAGAGLVWSYVSLTELSEYAQDVPAKLRQARLRPALPPAGLGAFCFYPMSKRRGPGASDANWYRLPYDERRRLMWEHGGSGRAFRGRVLQLITGSTGLDDWEWAVTLFGRDLEDLKVCVAAMRFDEASARYAEFGPFVVGTVTPLSSLLEDLGLAGAKALADDGGAR
ncbi:MAG: chlorite dismutase family protein [Acidimicrobiales bacterium]